MNSLISQQNCVQKLWMVGWDLWQPASIVHMSIKLAASCFLSSWILCGMSCAFLHFLHCWGQLHWIIKHLPYSTFQQEVTRDIDSPIVWCSYLAWTALCKCKILIASWFLSRPCLEKGRWSLSMYTTMMFLSTLSLLFCLIWRTK